MKKKNQNKKPTTSDLKIRDLKPVRDPKAGDKMPYLKVPPVEPVVITTYH
jgi:hypothetical protein